MGDLGADRQTFPLESNGGKTTTCSVQEYFRTKYRINLRYPYLNCLQVGPPNRNIYLPVEVRLILVYSSIANHRFTKHIIHVTIEIIVVQIIKEGINIFLNLQLL
ncbi:Protein argonaute-2 [Portunus trituberculatus]|uniref:Protein argonaute-2 n=1 Tax=Portunus trituberculatus TaxID=210409 RepID=A0A5B7J3A4_PORTR|nr:Protein argonaute-2 [Portunus trituberculatus]